MSDVVPPIAQSPAGSASHAAGRVVAMLAAAVLGSVIFVGALLAVVITVTHRPEWWSGWMAAMVISMCAAVFSLVPVSAGVFGGPTVATYGYLAGGAVRLLATLGGCLLAVLVARMAPKPTLLMAVPLYFAQLIAEPIVFSRAFLKRRPVQQ